MIFIPALRFGDDLGTVAAVCDPPTDGVWFQQGRDHVLISEENARLLHEWLGRALTVSEKS